MQLKTVVVGMSGGVDSSVTALLLKQQGFRVIGMFMKNWDEPESDATTCPAAADWEDVLRVCDQIGIPAYPVNFVQNYWDHVFSDFLTQLKKGYTPNPDILCNREIKFKVLLEKALELGADYLATGHYCQNIDMEGQPCLVKGLDPNKDQTYFLYTMQKEILKKVLFPVGGLLKSDLREFARTHGLATSEKKDSTGICFIGKRDFKPFVQQYIQYSPGHFERLSGEVVGKHDGAAYYTLGQRKGMGIGGPGEPWFVVGKDIDRNVVYVEQGTRHPALYCDVLEAEELTWVSGEAPKTFPYRCRSKVRYRQPDQECVVEKIEGGRAFVRFDIPQRSVTPGQSIVFYDGVVCLGGGIITNPGPSYHTMGRPLPEVVSP